MATVRTAWKPLRVLVFDTEARPLSFLGSDFVTKEITAIACRVVGTRRKPMVWALGEVTAEQMLGGFLVQYNMADLLVGHNIRTYDLPMLNGAALELGWAPIKPKLTQDTYRDLKRRQGVSASQETLGAMYELDAPKVGMNQVAWRSANRLTKDGIAKTKARVVGDVVQSEQLRAELLRRGWLRTPRVWAP